MSERVIAFGHAKGWEYNIFPVDYILLIIPKFFFNIFIMIERFVTCLVVIVIVLKLCAQNTGHIFYFSQVRLRCFKISQCLLQILYRVTFIFYREACVCNRFNVSKIFHETMISSVI